MSSWASPRPKIELRNLSMVYEDRISGRKVEAIKNVNLDIYENDFAVIIGPNGCGKSTLLSIMAGLLKPTTGEVIIGGKTRPGPRDVALMFQDSLLLPWRNVSKNIEFGLEPRHLSKEERASRVEKYLKLVRLEEFADAYPSQLSGGMKQRVALCRSLAMETDIVLMDEPFGALDEQTRIMLADELVNIWRSVKRTVVFVTHSLSEAVYLAERIVVMSSRPGMVKAILDVDIPRPRTFASPHFAQLLQTLWQMMGQGSSERF
ncbi:MAG TPA: ABC transporter ATP-binding protein [Acidimicrobiales bacterium]|nr:ABC transporter ATP-binding protein [Acidimicrobiales bacterium]